MRSRAECGARDLGEICTSGGGCGMGSARISPTMTKQAFRAFGVATKLHVLSVQGKRAMSISRPEEHVTYDDHIRKHLITKKITRTEEAIPLSSHCKTRGTQLPVQHQQYSKEVKCSIP